MANQATAMVRKCDVLMQLDEVIRDLRSVTNESHSKFNNEVSVSSRAYFQGQWVAGAETLKRLEKLRLLLDAY